jgi:hypothetical protein
MALCWRVDLDYVPWDTPDAEAYGHGEPAALLRLLQWSRERGLPLQFFVSNRVLRAFPASIDAIVAEGHAVDWLCKHPASPEPRLSEAQRLFATAGLRAQGLAVKHLWPPDAPVEPFSAYRFISVTAPAPPFLGQAFQVDPLPLREAVRSGQSYRSWVEKAQQVLLAASADATVTLAVRPQLLARLDPKLEALDPLTHLAWERGHQVVTLRAAILEARQSPNDRPLGLADRHHA